MGGSHPMLPPVSGGAEYDRGEQLPPVAPPPHNGGSKTQTGGTPGGAKIFKIQGAPPGNGGGSTGGSLFWDFRVLPPEMGGGALGESRGSIWSWILIIDIMEIRFFDLKYSKNFARNTRYIPCIFKVLKITKSLIFFEFKKI